MDDLEARKQYDKIELNLTIDKGALKRIVEEGRLMVFVDALSALASAQIKTQVIDQVAKGAFVQSGSLSVTARFDPDDPYYTGPRPWPGPRGIWDDVLRQAAVEDLVAQVRGV